MVRPSHAPTARDRSDTWNGHEQSAWSARSRGGNKLPVKLCSPGADTAPSFQQWHYDLFKHAIAGKQPAHMVFKDASCSFRNNEPEGFHETSYLIGKVSHNFDQQTAGTDKGTGQHAVRIFHPDYFVKANLGKMSQAVGIVCIGLVRRHIERCFGVPNINADLRDTLCSQVMIKPDRQRSRLEYHALCFRSAFTDNSRLPFRRTEIAVSFNDTSSPIYSSMVVSCSMLGTGPAP